MASHLPSSALSELTVHPSRGAICFYLQPSADDGIVVQWYVYILRCGDGSLYIGQSDNLNRRVARHNEGRGSAFTKERRPVTLVYSERYSSLDAAVKRERQLKGWTRPKKEALIAGDLALLKRL